MEDDIEEEFEPGSWCFMTEEDLNHRLTTHNKRLVADFDKYGVVHVPIGRLITTCDPEDYLYSGRIFFDPGADLPYLTNCSPYFLADGSYDLDDDGAVYREHAIQRLGHAGIQWNHIFICADEECWCSRTWERA